MIQTTAPARSNAVSKTKKTPKRLAATAEPLASLYRGRSRVIEIAVSNAFSDGVRRCQCPYCRDYRALHPVAGGADR
jgi:hypothetical protein